jgi:hypothetical protein
MKKRAASAGVIAILLVLLVLGGLHLRGLSVAPSGQKPLSTLSASNSSEFAEAFDAQPDFPRVVLLVSPT